MKLNVEYILFIFLFNLASSERTLQPFQITNDVKRISCVLHDIVDEFLLKEKIEFNVYFVKTYTEMSLQIFSEFLSKNSEKFRIILQLFKTDLQNEFYTVYRSAIFFMEDIEDFEVFEDSYNLLRYQNQPMKYVIFAPNLTYTQLETHWLLVRVRELTVFASSIFHHSYFVTNDNEETITLSTVEWFSPKACNHAHLTKLNTFDKKSMKWTSRLKNYEKFLQYHGCELVLMLPVPSRGTDVFYVSGYALIHKNQKSFSIHGISTIIFKIASVVNSFKDIYQPVHISQYNSYLIKPHQIHFIFLNETIRIPQIFLHVDSTNAVGTKARITNVFVDLSSRIVVTPAEPYTPYEKLFLPFDLETWILLVLTFFVTCFVIFIINRLPKSTQQLVYGQKIQNALWNVVSIFFGISQTLLPNENFPRFILTLFIIFCLIFRTCYQNKLFEFMTSEPRRPPPRTTEELIEMNYSVYAMIYHNMIHEYENGRNIR